MNRWRESMKLFVLVALLSMPLALGAPTVQITTPGNNAIVNGTIDFRVAVDPSVVGVQYRINGGNLGSEVTVAPFNRTWISGSRVNGTYTLTAVARDAANNTITSAPVTFTIANTFKLNYFVAGGRHVVPGYPLVFKIFAQVEPLATGGSHYSKLTWDEVPPGSTPEYIASKYNLCCPVSMDNELAFWLRTSESTPIGNYTLRGRLTLNSRPDVSVTFDIPVEVVPMPGPLPKQPFPPDIPAPNLAKYESQMIYWGKYYCTPPIGAFDTSNLYYDGNRVFQQIAEYTGNDSWYDCAKMIGDHYATYVINAGGAPGFRVFPHGLKMTYDRTGDNRSLQAIDILGWTAWNGIPQWMISYLGAARSTPYSVNAQLIRSSYGFEPRVPRQELAIEALLAMLDEMYVAETVPVQPDPFLTALEAEAAILYYDYTGDPRVPPLIKAAADKMWENAYHPGTQSLLLIQAKNPPAYSGPAPDLNLMEAPVFAWVYQQTGDPIYRDRADILFNSGVDKACLACDGKHFNQNYRWSMKYLEWRKAPPGETQPDTSPPTVTITSPTNGATVQGTVTLRATASDDLGVMGVQFKLDGANIGAEDTIAPYERSWNVPFAVGTHTLSATARDAAGKTTTTSITITIPVQPARLVAHYPLDDGAGSTAVDVIGGKTLTIQGPTWTAGKTGTGLEFDGVNDEAHPQADTVMSVAGQPLTYAAWIKTTSTTGSIIERGGGSYGAQLAITNGKASFSYRWGQTTSITTLTSTNNVNDNQWHHLTGTIDTNGAMTLYVDGLQAATGAGTLMPSSPNDGLSIGTNDDLGGSNSPVNTIGNYAGTIDDIRIYDNALTPSEITTLTGGNTPTTNPLAHWRFEETGNSMTDNIAGITGTSNAIPTKGWHGQGLGTSTGSATITNDQRLHLLNKGDYTISIWTRPEIQNPSGSKSIIVHLDGTGAGRVHLAMDTDKTNCPNTNEIWHYLGGDYHCTGYTITNNRWTLLTLTIKENGTNDEVKLYANNQLVNTATKNIENNDAAWKIGEHKNAGPTSRFPGTLDELRLYNTALTQQEITQQYNRDSRRAGDANKDGKRDILDILFIINQIKNKQTIDDAADPNEDGKANIIDLIYVVKRMG